MAVYKSLSKWVDEVKAVNNKATYRALNKAVAKANTQFKRLITKDTGLKSKDVTRRIKQKKASSKSLSAFVSLGTKFGIPLEMFKPKVKIIKKGKGRKARRYNGVSVSIPAEGGRFIVPGAFLGTVKSGKSLVLKRTTSRRLPVESMKYNIYKASEAHKESLSKFMRDDFKKQFSSQLKLLVK